MSKTAGLLSWCKNTVGNDYPGVSITNFSASWNDGLAFCAILHRHYPADIGPFDKLSGTTVASREKNFELAFSVAEKRLGCTRLFDVEDMIDTYPKPDSKSVVTYVSTLAAKLPAPSGSAPTPSKPGVIRALSKKLSGSKKPAGATPAPQPKPWNQPKPSPAAAPAPKPKPWNQPKPSPAPSPAPQPKLKPVAAAPAAAPKPQNARQHSKPMKGSVAARAAMWEKCEQRSRDVLPRDPAPTPSGGTKPSDVTLEPGSDENAVKKGGCCCFG